MYLKTHAVQLIRMTSSLVAVQVNLKLAVMAIMATAIL